MISYRSIYFKSKGDTYFFVHQVVFSIVKESLKNKNGDLILFLITRKTLKGAPQLSL